MLVAAHAQQLVHLDAAALVERQAELAKERVRAHAGRPDERARRDRRAVAEDGFVRGHRLERRPDVDLDAAARQLLRRVLAEAIGISGRIFGAASTSTHRRGTSRSRG